MNSVTSAPIRGTILEDRAETAVSLNSRLYSLTNRLSTVLVRLRGDRPENDASGTSLKDDPAAGTLNILGEWLDFAHDHTGAIEDLVSELERLV